MLQVVEERIRDWRHDQRQQQRKRLSAEDDEADGVIGGRADTFRHDERNHSRHERERRHQNRPQAIAAGLNDCLMGRQAALLQLIGVIDLQNRVLLHDAEEHQQAKRREDIERLLKDDD